MEEVSGNVRSAEVLEKLEEDLHYQRMELRSWINRLGDSWKPVEALLRNLRDNPDGWSDCRSEFGRDEAARAVTAARMEYGALSNQWWHYYFQEFPKVRREMHHFRRPDRQEVSFHPYINLEYREKTPDETGSMPATDDYLVWSQELGGLLDEAAAVWDSAEQLLTALILEGGGEPEPAEPQTSREKVLENLRRRMRARWDAEGEQLVAELLDPAAALEAYDKAYAQFRHLFYAYCTNLETRSLWEVNGSSGSASSNRDIFCGLSLRLSEKAMRLRRHAAADPGVLEKAERLKAAADEAWRQDEELFFDQVFRLSS